MGVRIGDVVSDLTAGRLRTGSRARKWGDIAPDEIPGMPKKRDPAGEIRAGFGKNTMSPSMAALRTINVNMERARRIVPSMDQLREEFRERRAEFEEAEGLDVQSRAEFARPPEASVRPEPAPQAVNAFQEEQEAVRSAQREEVPAPNPAPVPGNEMQSRRLDVRI